MANTKKENSKQGLLHFGSIAVAIVIIASYFVLGLDEYNNEKEVSQVNVEGINTDIPEPETQIQKSKLSAIVEEERRIREEKERAYRQNSSFDLMANLNTQEKEEVNISQDINTNISLEEIQNSEENTITTPINTIEIKEQEIKTTPVKTVSKKKKQSSNAINSEDWQERVEKEKELARKKAYEKLGVEYPSTNNQEEKTLTQEENISASQNKNPFISLNDNQSDDKSGIRIVTHGEQKDITASSQVRLRILDPITINGTTIPRNTEVIGQASFSSNRVLIKINNITYKNNVYPFKGKIYDKDGLEGIYIAENLVNEVSKETASSTISNSNYTAPGLTGLISKGTTALTSAVKNATTNSIKATKVTLPANYKLVLKID